MMDLRALADPKEEHGQEECENEHYAANKAHDDQRVVALSDRQSGGLDMRHTRQFEARAWKKQAPFHRQQACENPIVALWIARGALGQAPSTQDSL